MYIPLKSSESLFFPHDFRENRSLLIHVIRLILEVKLGDGPLFQILLSCSLLCTLLIDTSTEA